MKLAILIPTLKNRRPYLKRLMACLQPQLSAEAGVWTLEDAGVETTGAKRQRLIESVDADFVCHVDDDDLVASTYVADVLAAIEQGADVVGFRVRYYQDGHLAGYSVHSLAADRWSEQRDGDGLTHYTRTPNHLNPIRRELALAVGFANRTVGEDADYSHRLYEKFGKSMREVFIDKFLYEYLFRTPAQENIKMYEDSGGLTREAMEKTIKEGGSVSIGGRLCSKLEHLDQ